MMFGKKGQAALEFLMTYGWAFMVILIMIGALMYFGVLNVSKFLPDRCNAASPFTCKGGEYKITSATTDTLVFNLQNSEGTQMSITSINVSTDFTGACTALTDTATSVTGQSGNPTVADTAATWGTAVNWPAGETKTFKISCTTGDTLAKGDKVKFAYVIRYYPTTSSATFAKNAVGELYATVQ